MIRVSPEEEGEQWTDPKAAARRLDLPMWLTAWDSYALAGVALDQVRPSLSLVHAFFLLSAVCIRSSNAAQKERSRDCGELTVREEAPVPRSALR